MSHTHTHTTRAHTHTQLFLITGSQARTKRNAACPLGLTGRWLLGYWIDRRSDRHTHTYTHSLCVQHRQLVQHLPEASHSVSLLAPKHSV